VYRYGFNGKENDNEVKGTGNQQDYGERIYDPRGGRFLSVDPLTKSYPMLTPYQYASNSPISGVDLDGLEYLHSEDARIEVVRGIVKLKMANMHNITRNTFEGANSDPNNWQTGQIGINTQIGHIDWKTFVPNPVKNDLDNDPTHDPNKIIMQGLTIKNRSVLPESGYPEGEILPKAPIENTRLGRAGVLLDAIITGEQFLRGYLNNDDFNKVTNQTKLLEMATYDVDQAIKAGRVSSEILKRTDKISDVINYVLSGVSNLNDKEVISTGKAIFNEFSKQRLQYEGEFKITGPSGQVIMNRPRPNPIYNPAYGKEDNKSSN